ncbi:type II toxin-antitoxin system RelE/ParE family toxin [Sporosarcina sp. P34]|uniref:type II toxin-antitoxin system RelE/ParE family toxin n=1 Tax=Sporosarcina sp. P34 TaxID=2048247 RepID=UPI001E5A0C58|nr:type II toxin-antitoxin system RelE/ParE family toxin [Sporosarcina sp. P34]
MYVSTKKLKKILDSPKAMNKEFPSKVADAVRLRLTQLRAAENLSQITHHPPMGLHKLTGNRKNQFAIWAKEKYRIVFHALDEEDQIIKDLDVPKDTIQKIKIIEVVNYHV